MEIQLFLCKTRSAFSIYKRAAAEVSSLQRWKKQKDLQVYLKEHVSRLYSSIGSNSSSFHDGADVNAAVSPVVALTDNTDTQKVVLLCGGWKEMRTSTVSALKNVIYIFINQIVSLKPHVYPCWAWPWWCWGSWWSLWYYWRMTTRKAGRGHNK